MDEPWTPTLRLRESGRLCRLSLEGVTTGEGETMQEAADDLIARLTAIAVTVRRSGFMVPSELGPPNLEIVSFLYELAELVASGGDVRTRLFGVAADSDLAA